MDEFKNNLKNSTGFRIFLYLFALLICTLAGSGIAFVLMDGDDVAMAKIGQGISSAMLFIVPPLVLYAFTRPQPLRQIGFRKPLSPWMLLIGATLMFVSLPLTNLLTSWNEAMKLPEALSPVEDVLKTFEETAREFTEQMLQADTFRGLLGNLLVIALIPAVGEELTFRGVLQQALAKRCKNVHVAVFLSAFIFSFIHLQFYGFLPRLFLGLLLGYLFFYSDSLWTSILMHFLNNGSAVVVAYLDHKGLINVDMDHFGATDNVWLILLSLALTVGGIVLCNQIKYKYGRK